MSNFTPAALLVALLLLLAGPVATSAAAPAITVTPDENVDPTGDTLTVQGTGFTADALGIYVAFGPKRADFATNADPYLQAKWVRAGAAGENELKSDGSFAVTIPADAKYTTQNGESINCFTEPGGCKVLTMKAHGTPIRNQDTDAAVDFAPLLTVTPSENLDADQDVEVTVTGEGYKYQAIPPTGFYLAFGPKRSDFNTNPLNYYKTKWMRAGAAPSPAGGPVNADGTFTTTLTVRSSYTDTNATPNTVDCEVQECSVLTFHDHNDPSDRTQDAAVPLTFGEDDPVDPGPDDNAPPGDTTPPPGGDDPPAGGGANPPPPAGNGPVATPLRVSALRVTRKRMSFLTSGAATLKVRLYRPQMRNGKLRWRLARSVTLRALRAGRIGIRHRLKKAGPVRVVVHVVGTGGTETAAGSATGRVPKRQRR